MSKLIRLLADKWALRKYRITVHFGASLAILGLVLTFNNCTNPRLHPADSNITSVGNPYTTQRTQEFLEKICEKIVDCHTGLVMNTCRSGVVATSGIAEKIGLPFGVYQIYADVISAETAGTIAANAPAVGTCETQIQDLSCALPQVQNAYVASAPQPFQQVPNMIPTTAGTCNVSFYQQAPASPSPAASPGASPTPTPIPTPTPSPGVIQGGSWCNYYDITSVTPGSSYSCPSHGSPADTTFIESVFLTSYVQAYTDGGCTVPAQMGVTFSSVQSYNQNGVVPNTAYGGGTSFDISQPVPCMFHSTNAGYYKIPTPLGSWSAASSRCLWQTTLATCPP